MLIRNFFLILTVSFFCVLEISGITLEEITNGMSEEDLVKTGLFQLTDNEKKELNVWLQYQSKNYFLSIPKIKNSGDHKFFLKTEKRQPENTIGSNWELALVAVFQNETPYLREFIEFHKLMGVQHFYLYDNMSSENFLPEIKKYIESGEVELFEWPVENFVYGQCSCYKDAIYRSRGKAKWLIIADTDLFFFPIEDSNLIEFLKKYDHPLIGGVTSNYLNFGTSNVESVNFNSGELLTELLVRCSSEIDKAVRCIVRPERVESVDNPHFAKYYPQYFAVDENYSRNEGPFNEKRPANKIRINHYMFRTLDFLKNVFGLRHARFSAEHNGEDLPVEVSQTTIDFLLKLDADNSKSQDTEIHRFTPLLKESSSL